MLGDKSTYRVVQQEKTVTLLVIHPKLEQMERIVDQLILTRAGFT